VARQRRLVPVREDIVEELAEIAKRSGLTVSELVEAILSHAVKVLRGRDDVVNVLVDSIVYADIARLGGVPVPLQGLIRMLNGCGEGCGGFVGEAYRLARLVAMSTKARGVDLSRGIVTVLRALLPGQAIDIVEGDEGDWRVIVAGQSVAGAYASFVEEVVRGAVEGFGGNVEGVEREEGIVVVRFKLKE
jgi:hypothetical protein